ncbi:MAG: hypothetical protein ACKOYN_04860, partial [Planctomycetota bacterium]
MANADVHVLGSRSGYCTRAASPSVTRSEREELEQLHLGEVGSASEAAALRERAAMSGRPLRSGRIAISRMMPSGAVDDAGRPTVEVVSVILDPRDYVECTGALPRLSTDAAWWDAARDSVSGGVRVPEADTRAQPSSAKMLSMLDAWMHQRRAGGVVVLSSEDAGALLEFVALLADEDQQQCRWGVGMSSPSLLTDICALSPGGNSSGMRKAIRMQVGGRAYCPDEIAAASRRSAG